MRSIGQNVTPGLAAKSLHEKKDRTEWPIMFTQPSDAEVSCMLILDFAIGTESGSELIIARALVVR